MSSPKEFNWEFLYSITLYIEERNVIAYKVYQVLALSSLSTVLLATSLLIFQKHTIFGHTTARILAVCFKVTKMIQSSFAITLTILLLTFRYSIFMISIMNLHGYIIVAAFQQSFLSLLIVIDIGIRASKPQYGSNVASVIFIFASVVLTTALSYLLWYLMVFCFVQNFIIVFISLSAGLQMFNALLTIYLQRTVKEMRRKSVLLSSLAERHECFKNLEIVRYFFPKSIIGLICGILSLTGTLTTNYIFPSSPYVSYVCCFAWYEVAAIITSSYAMIMWLKQKYFNNKITIRIISKHAVQTVDSHFDNLKQMWS